MKLMQREIAFKYYEDVDRSCEIKFYTHINLGVWKFNGCKYVCQEKEYNFKDWQFLKNVAEEIIRLERELNPVQKVAKVEKR